MASPSLDPGAFRTFEHSGWQKTARRYHDYFANLTPQTLGPLLNAVAVGRGVRVLDVASGPGYGAAAAAQRGAVATGIDFSAAMVAQARQHYPHLKFLVGDAEQLPFAEGSFAAIITNFGVLHWARPEQALREACRALRSGGRIGFTVWAKPEEAVGFGMILRAIETHGNLNVPLPPGPPFFRFSDPAECCRILLETGFQEPSVTPVPLVWRLPSPDALLEAMQEGTVRTGGLLRAQSEEALQAIRAAIREAARAYEKNGSLELPMPAVLASATKA